MKTAKDWFKENLTDEQYLRAWKLMQYQGRLDFLEKEYSSFRNALTQSFTWRKTPEDDYNEVEANYWDDIYMGRIPDVMPCKKEEQTELEIAKKILEDKGYFIFPKAEEGDFPDLSGFDGAEMEFADSQSKPKWFRTKVIMKFARNFITKEIIPLEYIRKPLPRKRILTLAEIAEKFGLDVNEIEIEK